MNWQGQRIVRNVREASLLAFPAPSDINTGIAVVIAPGGGFRFLAIDREGTELARWLNERGINAFVLKYRLDETACSDLLFRLATYGQFANFALSNMFRTNHAIPEVNVFSAQAFAVTDGFDAISTIRQQADRWQISPEAIGMIGFSAGALVTTAVAASEQHVSRPNFVASIYGVPVLGALPESAPPLFIVATEDDPIVPPTWAEQLQKHWRSGPHVLHLYPEGGHGFGMQMTGAASDHWFETFYQWIISVVDRNHDGSIGD